MLVQHIFPAALANPLMKTEILGWLAVPAANTIGTALAAQVSGATNTIYYPANRIYRPRGI